ncbi:hypothetical protein GTQ99_08370 [Kineococcus sp. T13]|uniref:hypothetical protein n=1 Tax=Kineococcus vitellinus TaxID=2696565 RepID=UPI001412EE24|nr:hypothetical protein [Kineococcus vitellinus]NAZ75435.1 hypothetical protein [Kineococcus vitellinus]
MDEATGAATGEAGRPGVPARRMHLVGTLPQFHDAAEALAWQVGELAGRVRRLSGGETAERSRWIVPVVQRLAQQPVLRRTRSGDWTGYDDVDRFALRRGRRLLPEHLDLRIAEHAEQELELLARSSHPATPDLPLQVGLPGHLDVALFAFGAAGVPRTAAVVRRALGREIARAVAGAGTSVVFQLELPAELVALTAAPAPARPALARVLAALVVRQVAEAPPGTRFGVHLCLGDLGHRALRQLPSAAPLARLTTALVRAWPAGRPLEFVHLPLSGGDGTPPADPAFYAPLRALRAVVPEHVQLIAGLAHEEQPIEEQVRLLAVVEDALGRRVDVATSCGLGRRPPAAAAAAVRATLRLLDA